MIDEIDEGIGNLSEVMGRNIGGHAHGDTRTAVGKQVGKLGRKHNRLFQSAVEVGHEIDGALIEVIEELDRNLRQPRLGVPVSSRRVSVDRPEIPLPFDERIPEGEILGHPHEGIVNGKIPVRMIFTYNLPDHSGAFPEGPVREKLEIPHSVEDPALHRFQPIPGIGQRPSHDHAHGVIDIGRAHFIFYEGLDNATHLVLCVIIRDLRAKGKGIVSDSSPSHI